MTKLTKRTGFQVAAARQHLAGIVADAGRTTVTFTVGPAEVLANIDHVIAEVRRERAEGWKGVNVALGGLRRAVEEIVEDEAGYAALVEDRANQIALGAYYEGNEIDADIAATRERLAAAGVTPETWLHYGYDGSGRPLHTRVAVDAVDGERAKVRFPGFVPPLDRLGGDVQESDGRWVRADRLRTDPTTAPLASFNWLD